VSELPQELEATVAARREVGAELEPQLIDQFLARMEAEIDRRVAERAAPPQRQRPRPIPLALPLGSLGIAIPLVGAAGGIAGLAGVIAVCIAIVLVNVIYISNMR
jgi:hypothetical protein